MDHKEQELVEIRKKLKGYIVTGLSLEGVKPEEIKDDAVLFGEGLGLDSLDAVEIVVLLQRNWGVDVKDMNEGRIPQCLSIADRMRRKLRTKKGKVCYGLRKELPEPVFGQIKQVRGFDHFLLRGLENVSSEWKVICTGHNLLKLFRACGRELFSRKSPALVLAY